MGDDLHGLVNGPPPRFVFGEQMAIVLEFALWIDGLAGERAGPSFAFGNQNIITPPQAPSKDLLFFVGQTERAHNALHHEGALSRVARRAKTTNGVL